MFNQAVCDLTFESEIKFDCAQMLQATGTHTLTQTHRQALMHTDIWKFWWQGLVGLASAGLGLA